VTGIVFVHGSRAANGVGASPQLRPLRYSDDEAGVVVANILHTLLEHGEAVTLARCAAGDRPLSEVTTLGDLARRAGGVGGGHRSHAEFAQTFAALLERLCM